jgi:hypothetical protein
MKMRAFQLLSKQRTSMSFGTVMLWLDEQVRAKKGKGIVQTHNT